MADRETLAAFAELSQEIRKSRFVARAAAIDTVAAAIAFIESASAADAGHNCWAYRIGDDYRFNDDGEPGGTAGRPILAAIEGQGLDGVAVVVSRWFGGIKLGAGGLMRAYGRCAAECLR
ncbi:MAG: YigZ family protein, partial [Dokdonella sp.]